MTLTIPKFEKTAEDCSLLMSQLPKERQAFFNDDLRTKAYFMAHLSKSVYHATYAYKHQTDKDALSKHLDLAIDELKNAQRYLLEAQHGPFQNWYDGESNGKLNINKVLDMLEDVKKNQPK
jgi:hypothetical protein